MTHTDYADDFALVANIWRRRYPFMEREDIVQELLLWFYANPDTVKQSLAVEEDERDPTRHLRRRLNDVAHATCRREKAQRSGYQAWDEAFYTPALLTELIPVALSDDRTKPQTGDRQRSSAPAHEGNTHLAQIADVEMAFSLLGETDRMLVRRRYCEGVTSDEIADAMGVNRSTTSSRIARALRRMSDALGGTPPRVHHDDGPGTRRVMSNAAAQAATTEQENG